MSFPEHLAHGRNPGGRQRENVPQLYSPLPPRESLRSDNTRAEALRMLTEISGSKHVFNLIPDQFLYRLLTRAAHACRFVTVRFSLADSVGVFCPRSGPEAPSLSITV